MSKPSSMNTSAAMTRAARNRQFGYAIGILVIFSLMWPYNEWVSKIKADNDLGEATIGQIDTGGFMLKLGMIGGFRGVVANYLWSQVRQYERVHEWHKMKNTVDFITRLQPHFLTIWTYQGWNLAYNVSVEWDAPDDKYVWIKSGINFLKSGVAKNQKMKGPDLIWDTAWTYYHKFGFADEAFVLRRLFRDDPDEDGTFKIDPISRDTKHDNFQVARGWFLRAIAKVDADKERVNKDRIEEKLNFVDRQKQHKGTPGDMAFFTMPAHSQTRYAGALEKQSIRDIEATFGGVARNEWDLAYNDWLTFGRKDWPVFRYESQLIQLDDSTNPERFAKLSPEQKHWCDRWANDTNYRYWKDRSRTERDPDCIEARRFFYNGLKSLKTANLPEAVDNYRQGLKLWETVLSKHPLFGNDEETRKDTKHTVRRYLIALKQVGEKEPENYPFKDLMKGKTEDYAPDPFDQMEVSRQAPTTTPAKPAAPPR